VPFVARWPGVFYETLSRYLNPDGQRSAVLRRPEATVEPKGSVHVTAPRPANEVFDLPVILNVFPMNVEKTMEFILQQQAKAEVKAERQMTAIRKLIQTGMRMIVKNEELIKNNEESIKELAAAQRVTEAKLQDLAAAQKVTEIKLKSLIDAWRRGGNGRHGKN
jgi:hypothetical protein